MMASWQTFRQELRRSEVRWGYIFAAITLIPVIIFAVIPMLSVFYFAFTDFTVFSPKADWVGTRNFQEAVDSELFLQALRNTLEYALYRVPSTLVVGLLVAVLLNRRVRGISVVRAIYYLPGLTSVIAVSVVWLWLFDPRFGMVNVLLEQVGIPAHDWLDNPATAMQAVATVSVWMGFGYVMLVFLAGLQGIPTMLYEAAAIDGANRWQMFRYITLPLLQPVTFYLFVTGVISSLQVFGIIMVLTQGGPLDRTTTLVHQIYLNALTFDRMGYASALSLILFIIIMVLTLINVKLFSREIEL